MHKKVCLPVVSTMLSLSLFTVTTFADEITNDSEPLMQNQTSSANITESKSVTKDLEGKAISAVINKDDILIAENSNLELYVNESVLSLKIKDKKNDYVWASVASTDYFDTMSAEWQKFTQSAVVMDYLMPNGTVKRTTSSGAVIKVSKIDSGLTAKIDFKDAKISLEMKITLNNDGITVDIPDDSISVSGNNVINKLYVMPFLGASYKDKNPGYIFIPDGSGALMRFADSRSYTGSYISRIYGQDYSVQRPEKQTTEIPTVAMENATIPVFGVAHGGNQNAFVGIVSGGEEFCEIEASPAGNMIDYFWVAPRFIYNEIYWQPTGGKGGFPAITPNKNNVNAKVDYKFLSNEEANYVGMAKKYRSILEESGELVKKVDANKKGISIKFDAVMGDETKGLIGNELQVMTTVKDVEAWVKELSENGLDNMVVSLFGFEKDGASGHKLGSFKVDKKFGSAKDLENLNKLVNELNSTLLLQTDFSWGYEHQISKKDVIYSIDGGIVDKFESKPLYSLKNYINNTKINSIVDSLSKLPDYKNDLALNSLGNTLNSNYKRGNSSTRDIVVGEIENILNKANENTDTLLLEAPNSYAFKYADAVYNLSMNNSKLIFETDTVPFIQIVLSGYLDMYSPYMNYGSSTMDDILKLIDYNTYPSYILSEEYSNKFAKTNLNDIYSSRFDDWKENIIGDFNYVNNILSNIRGKSIVNRSVPQDGISVVEYEGGTTIVINYTENSFNYGTESIGAKSAKVVKGV